MQVDRQTVASQGEACQGCPVHALAEQFCDFPEPGKSRRRRMLLFSFTHWVFFHEHVCFFTMEESFSFSSYNPPGAEERSHAEYEECSRSAGRCGRGLTKGGDEAARAEAGGGGSLGESFQSPDILRSKNCKDLRGDVSLANIPLKTAQNEYRRVCLVIHRDHDARWSTTCWLIP